MAYRLLAFFLLLSAIASPSRAQQLLRIGQARKAKLGTLLVVRGVVANGPELGGVRYLMDGQAGLAAYSTAPAFAALQPGDSVELKGTLKNFNGLLELSPVSVVQLLGQHRPLPMREVAFDDLASVYDEAHESQLIRITDVPFLTSATGVAVRTLAGNTNYLLGGLRGAVLRIPASSSGPQGLVGSPAPMGVFSVLGIMGQYTRGTGSTYHLQPRLLSDLEVGHGRPEMVGPPIAIETSQQTVKVRFITQNPGDTRIDYGRTAELGSVVTNAAATTTHIITLTGLKPGTTYHVRATSTNEAGTSTSSVVLLATDSRRRSASSVGEPDEEPDEAPARDK